MLISRDRLSIEVITDCWSQEIDPRTSREELLDFLEVAWWRRQLKTDGPLTPLALLKSMYRSAREDDLTTLVFVTKEDAILPKGIELPDGSLQLDDNDLKPRIVIPSDDPETWTEASCAPAFQCLAQKPSRKYYLDRTIQFLMMEIDRQQFTRLLTAHGLALPNFWMPSIPTPPELEKEAHISTGSKPSSEDESSALVSEIRLRGPKPKKFEQTRQAIKHDIRESRLTVTSLREMLEKKLEERYGVSRDTARKARAVVLAEEAMRLDMREGRRNRANLVAMPESELGKNYGVSPGIASKARAAVLSEFVEKSNPDK